MADSQDTQATDTPPAPDVPAEENVAATPAPGASEGGTAVPTGAGKSTSVDTGDKSASVDKTPEDKRSVEQIAADYLIPISDSAKAEWEQHPAEFLAHAIEVAKGLYPTLAPQIAAGVSTKTLVDPYVQLAKQVLGPETEPDFGVSPWTKALEGGVDPKTQRPTLMPLSQWRNTLMSDPAFGYDKSGAAIAKAQQFGQQLHAAFGGGQ